MRPSFLLLTLTAIAGCQLDPSSLVVQVSPWPVSVGSSTQVALMVSQGSFFAGHHVTEASCDDGACEVTTLRGESDHTVSGWSTIVQVRPLRTGNLTMRFKVVTDDGEEVEGTHPISCIDAEEVSVERAGVQVKGNDVVLVGSSLSYLFDVFGPNRSAIIVSWEGMSLTFDGLEPVSASLGDASSLGTVNMFLDFVARQPGMGTVSIRAGIAVGTHRVRIAPLDEVASVTLHRVLVGNERNDGETYESAPFDGAAWEDRWNGGVELVPISRLADGTRAVGGSEGCTVSQAKGVRFGTTGGLRFGAHADQNVQATVTFTCVIGAGRAEATVLLKGFGT